MKHEFVPEIIGFLKQFAGNYLEIGLYDGVNFSTIAQAVPDKLCYGVDPFLEDGWTQEHSGAKKGETLTNQYHNATTNIKDLPNVRFFKMTSIEFNNSLTRAIRPMYSISCVYIDGSHNYIDVLNDMHMAVQLIDNQRGLIIFDDLQIPDVKRVVDEDARRCYPQHFDGNIRNIYHINV